MKITQFVTSVNTSADNLIQDLEKDKEVGFLLETSLRMLIIIVGCSMFALGYATGIFISIRNFLFEGRK